MWYTHAVGYNSEIKSKKLLLMHEKTEVILNERTSHKLNWHEISRKRKSVKKNADLWVLETGDISGD